jgi:fumarate reductase flavoprotein subunit
VVIVGAGLAGVNAAYDLKLKYPSVNYVLLEKRDVIMGSLPLSGGTIFATTSYLHKQLNKECTIADIIQLMAVASEHSVRDTLITKIYSNSKEIFERLLSWGAPFYTANSAEYSNPYLGNMNIIQSNSVANPNVWTFFSNNDGGSYASVMIDLIYNRIPIKNNLRINSEVTDLVVSGGQVTGVRVRDKQKTYTIKAKAVLLTTGGFGADPESVKLYAPEYFGGYNQSNSGATGDGIRMTRQFNTPIVGSSMIAGGLYLNPATTAPRTLHVVVNKEGTRPANEADSFDVVKKTLNQNAPTEGPTLLYSIMDGDFPDVQQYVANGNLTPYNDLTALANAKGINATTLAATITAYNGTASEANKLETPPFYAAELHNAWAGSVPGLKVDDDMRVVDGSDNVVPGLYAAGETTEGNLYEKNFPGMGVAGSYATYSGVYAARRIVANELELQ